jgi:exosortase
MTEDKAPEPCARLGFREEFLWYWQRWPNKALWLGAFAGWLLLFHFLGNSTFGYTQTPSLFGWMRYCYDRAADDEHGYLIPLVVLVLFWWKRRELLDAVTGVWWPALGVVAPALGIHVLAYMVQQTRISILAFFLGMWGLLGFVWGRRFLRASFFPMVLFVFCVPLATVSTTLTFPLRLLVTKLSVGIGSGVLAMPIVGDGSIIRNSAGVAMYDVAPACSGIRSLTALGAITMIYAFMSFKAGWQRWLILFSAIPLAVAGNVARVTTVMVLGDAFGHDLAMRLEQHLGLVTFSVAVVSLLLLGNWLRKRVVYA